MQSFIGVFQAKSIVNLCVKLRFNFRKNIDCIDRKYSLYHQICHQKSHLPKKFITTHNLTLKYIRLADPCFNVQANIDMLIGAELF